MIGCLFAFLAGSVVLNVFKEELPDERESCLGAFLQGGVVQAALLLALRPVARPDLNQIRPRPVANLEHH
ncbi:hypothetical protein [Palleronia sp.]|uniref:hypothetical protein n=1 Tax=Palleronia sp. TaxID=1940284 RepID=UPI0035C7A365